MLQKFISFILLYFAVVTFCRAQTNYLPSSGNVGIGVSPLVKLHVKGDTRIERQSGGGNHFLFRSDSDGNYLITDDSGSNHKNMYFRVLSSHTGSNIRSMYFQTGRKDSTIVTRMMIRHDGRVGIGTTNPQAKLAVNGNILAAEVKVKTDISVPDYVFNPDYELLQLAEVEAYVKEHRHLPEIPSAADIQRDGLDLAEMNLLLLKKVEELTLYLFEKDKSEKRMALEIQGLKSEITELKTNKKRK